MPMIIMRPDIKRVLADAGYTSYVAKTTKTMATGTLHQIIASAEAGTHVSLSSVSLNTLCMILDCQPADLITYVPDSEELSALSDKWPDLHREARDRAAREELEARISELQEQLARMEESSGAHAHV